MQSTPTLASMDAASYLTQSRRQGNNQRYPYWMWHDTLQSINNTFSKKQAIVLQQCMWKCRKVACKL